MAATWPQFCPNNKDTENVTIANDKNIILNLNGTVMKANLSDSHSNIVITNNGALTIEDTSTTNNIHYF